MKKLNTIAYVIATVFLLASCAAESKLQKDIKKMDIHFKPLSRADVTLVGGLEAEAIISGNGVGALDPQYAKDRKQGLISKSEATEIMYFAPSANEVITGSLYENDIFNSVYGSLSLANLAGGKGRLGLLQKLKGAKLVTASDPGMDFAYYALVEKYPDVDYFINVRFDRKRIAKGSGKNAKYTETVTVKADGVKLKTDN